MCWRERGKIRLKNDDQWNEQWSQKFLGQQVGEWFSENFGFKLKF